MAHGRALWVLAMAGGLAIEAARAGAQCLAPPEPSGPCTLPPGTHCFSLEHEEELREYDVTVPAGCSHAHPFPLVFDLHGLGSTKAAQAAISGLRAKADEAGFVVVHPQAARRSFGFFDGPAWGATGVFGFAGTSDVGFLRAIVEVVAARLPVDAERIYATGLSNGGAMTHYLACEAADLFAAVAPVAFPLHVPSFCSPSRPIPVLHFHGWADDWVWYDAIANPGVPCVNPFRVCSFGSAPASLANWAEIDGCTGPPVRTLESGGAFCDVHEDCDEGVQTGLCTLDAGHVPYANGDVDIADVAWAFLSRFPTPLPEPGATARGAAACAALWAVGRVRSRLARSGAR